MAPIESTPALERTRSSFCTTRLGCCARLPRSYGEQSPRPIRIQFAEQRALPLSSGRRGAFHTHSHHTIGRDAGQIGEEEPCIFLLVVFVTERLFACRNQLTACVFPGNFNLSLELLQIGPLFTLKGLAYLGASFQKTYYWQLLLRLTCPQPSSK